MRLILLAALLLAGCAGGPRVVLTPVRQPCIAASDVPAPTPPVGQLPDDARQALLLVAATLIAARGENAVLRSLIGPCTR